MKKLLIPTLALVLAAASASAASLAFDFKDPKGVNNATFKLEGKRSGGGRSGGQNQG